MAGCEGILKMITLTYKGVDDWQPKDITSFIRKMRTKLGDGLLAYCWVAELQKRGALHYHVLVWVKKGTRIPYPDKAGWWTGGMTSIVKARSPYYVLTYVSKEYQKDFDKFPKGARVYAVKIYDQGLDLLLKYDKLKDWEQGIVNSEGWGELKFWRKHHKACSTWIMQNDYTDKTEAYKQYNDFKAFFEERDRLKAAAE
jgi:hypothetical protein